MGQERGLIDMQFGWCAPLADAGRLAAARYDYVELPLAACVDRFPSPAAAKAALTELSIPPRAFNYFFPNDMRVVGPVVDVHRVKAYLARAAELLHAAGARIAVCGAGWARNCPDWPLQDTEDQFVTALSWAADAIAGSGTTVVIEPLNRMECRLVNSVAVAARIARRVNRPEIRILADFYHMDEEREPLSEIVAHREQLAHVHLADTGRLNPGTGTYDYPTFFGCLKAAAYQGTMSVECRAERDEPALSQSLAFLRRQWADATPATGGVPS
jgi:sugar phosphate isomerase/epimerase